MARSKDKNRQVITELPAHALTVAEYARNKGYSTAWIYKQNRSGKSDFQIVIFQGINFVI